MPRRSAASLAAAAAEGVSQSPTTTTHEPSLLTNGDTSLLTAELGSTPAKAPRTSTSKAEAEALGIDDLLLPRTLTSRLARGMLPPNTSIQKDALLALTKSATVFISHLASTANEQSTRKTLGPQDVLAALREMEFGTLVGLDVEPGVPGRLERELEMWEGKVKGKRKGYREKVKARESEGGEGEGAGYEQGEDEGGEPKNKRARMEEAVEGEEDAHAHGRTSNGAAAASSPEDAEDDEDEEEDAEGDDTESVEDDVEDEEEDEAEVEQREGSGVDDYGPDEQLRHEAGMNGHDDSQGDEESD